MTRNDSRLAEFKLGVFISLLTFTFFFISLLTFTSPGLRRLGTHLNFGDWVSIRDFNFDGSAGVVDKNDFFKMMR